MATSISSRKVLIALTPIALLLAIVQWSDGERNSGGSEDTHSSEQIVPGPKPIQEQLALIEQQTTPGSQEAPTAPNAPTEAAQREFTGSDESSDDEWYGGPQTTGAMDQPTMRLLTPGDARYDATTEARQWFNAFEVELLAADPLEPANYRTLLGQHKSDNSAALKRVMDLRTEGREEAATELYDEWSRLFEMYRKRAYSRAPSK